MVGKFERVKEDLRNTKNGQKLAYTAVIDGKFYGMGFSKDLTKNIPVGATVEFSVTENGAYKNLGSIAVVTTTSSAPETKTVANDQYAALNRKLAVEVASAIVNSFYNSRKQQVPLPDRVSKTLAYADIITNYIATGDSVFDTPGETAVEEETTTEEVKV